MANIILRPDWHLPDRLVTPENAFLHRRRFLRQMGFAGAGLVSMPVLGLSQTTPSQPDLKSGARPAGIATNTPAAKGATARYPARRNPDFNPPWDLTPEPVAANYNNFYEFTTTKDRVHRMVDRFVTAPWPVQIGGLVEKPMTIDVQELTGLIPLEERVYRFRCVEAWAMIVPWTGFPMSKLISHVSPKTEARFVRFETFFRPSQAPGFGDTSYPWPYTEGLRLDEAMNPLTMVVTGIYGKPLPKQHGAPIRIIVPWKYGYKSIKSIVKMEFVAKQPATLWETMAPHEYPFESNVNPAVPHPRWSQATERMIDTGDRVKTKPFNGYASFVSRLY